jgi:hypothetical protein
VDGKVLEDRMFGVFMIGKSFLFIFYVQGRNFYIRAPFLAMA